jgi:hypothetical protein
MADPKPPRRSKRREMGALGTLLAPASIKLLSANGGELVRQIGIDVVRSVILDVLIGKNLRSSTEGLTRRRIAALNLAMVSLFLRGIASSSDFIAQLPDLAAATLMDKGVSKAERWLAQWILGLTDKAFQNILRDDPGLILDYRNRYVEACREIIDTHIQQYGQLSGILNTDTGEQIGVDWLFVTFLLNAVGAQTLTIRGSEKSAYGKLFEKLILGSLLVILGFQYTLRDQLVSHERVFWLSSRDEKRESDATLLYSPGKGVRFDIGFIGRGNPEISLDKVTRFAHEAEIGGSSWYTSTIIIVDRIGKNSRIAGLANQIGGDIVQMSATYWPQIVARILNRDLGYEHPLVNMNHIEIERFLKDRLVSVPIEAFINLSNE